MRALPTIAFFAPTLDDPQLCSALCRTDFAGERGDERERAERALHQLVGDAATSLRLIDGEPGARLLEVGGGAGITYAWLRHHGVNITSLEPGLAGHDGYYQIGKRLLSRLGISDDGWLPLRAEDAPTLGRDFDLIFSNNVLEHLSDLEAALDALVRCLAADGRMRHNCPNYLVPYEPHFGLPLPPLRPRLAEHLMPWLRDSQLWQSLNFVDSLRLWRAARGLGLTLQFDRDHLYNTFLRLRDEPTFGAKHPTLARLFSLLDATHLLFALRLIPPALGTPIQITLRR